jgi:hypothetical protein
VCLCVAEASHSHRTWAEVSSSAPHFLHKGLSLSPIMWRCLLRVLRPVSRPVTTLDERKALLRSDLKWLTGRGLAALDSGSAVVRLLGLWVWIRPGAWTSFPCECCVLLGRGLCVQSSPTERGVSKMSVIAKPHKERPWPGIGQKRHRKKRGWGG